MVCICDKSLDPISRTLDALHKKQAPAEAEQKPHSEAEKRVTSVADWMGTRLLPSPPWQPKPEWLERKLPVPQMKPESLGTLSAIGTLRHLAMESFGIDPLAKGKATPMARVIATLNERVGKLAKRTEAVDVHRWTRLAHISQSAEQVERAAKTGLFTPTKEQERAYLEPGGRPIEHWARLLDEMQALAPLVAMAKQLGPHAADPEALAETMRHLKSIKLPELRHRNEAARLTSLFHALRRLKEIHSVDPTELGEKEMEHIVEEKAKKAAASIPHGAKPPKVTRNPSLIAPPAAIEAAQAPIIAELAKLNWRVPPMHTLPVLHHFLPAAGLVQVLPPDTAQRTPCAKGCDATSVLRKEGWEEGAR